jgi:hypothetical protein
MFVMWLGLLEMDLKVKEVMSFDTLRDMIMHKKR